MSKETYELAILLSLKDNASNNLNSFLGTLKKLQFEGKATLKILKEIEKASEKGFASKTKTSGGNNFLPKGIKDAEKELDRIISKTDKNKGIVNRLANFNNNFIEPTRQIADVWRRETDSLRQYTDETKRLFRAQEQFKLLNLSNAENSLAFDAVNKTVKEIRGAKLSDTTETLTDLFNSLGNVKSAIEMLPVATKYRANYEALYGESGNTTQQIQNAFKFLEIIGASNKGRAEMEKQFDAITKISSSTGGRITGVDFLNMARRGKTAVRNLSPEGLRNISSLIEETSADNVGTSMMSLYQALVGGVMKQSAAERFDYFGLVDRSKIEYNKVGRIKRLQPGANLLGDLAMEDPLKAADRLRDAMSAKGVNVADAKAVDKELAVLFGNRNAQALMSSLINQRAQIVKESDRAANAKGVLQTDEQLSNSPLKKIQEYEAALINFKTNAGLPLIEVMSKLAETGTPILRFFAEHPTLTKFAIGTMIVAKGLKAVSETASILSGSGSQILSFFNRTSSSANATSAAVGSATKKVGGLRNSVSSLKNHQFGVTVSVLAVTGLIEAVQYAFDKATAAGIAQNNVSKGSQDNYSVWVKTEEELKKIGKGYTQQDISGKANMAWSSALSTGLRDALPSEFNKQDILTRYFKSAKQTTLYPLAKYTGSENKFNNGFGLGTTKQSIGTGFKFANKELQDPRVMLEFLRQLPKRIPDKTDQEKVKAGLNEAYPKVFAEATAQLQQEQSKLLESTSMLSTSFLELSQNYNQQNQNTESANNFQKSLNDLQQLFPQTTQNLGVFGDTAKNTVSPITEMTSAANRARIGLDSLYSKFENFSIPVPTYQTYSPFSSAGSSLNNSGGLVGFTPPPKATGGRVLKDGLVYVHEDEDIVPASVTSHWKPNKSTSTGEITINAPMTVTLNGGSKEDESKFRELLYKHQRDLVRILARQMELGRARA